MIKKYNFENSANKKLMAEILSKRGRQPRAAFLSSLAAVMVAAISLTMVFGSLSTSALPVEEPKQQANVTSVSDGDTLPPEIVTRVHTETKTETVTVYNNTPQLSEALVISETVSEDLPSEGKAIFDQEKQLFQWQYNGETFTFFVKDNTVYRRSETTNKTVAVFKGGDIISLYCITDRYLFFKASTYGIIHTYCYRADLITKDILRLFNCYNNRLYPYSGFETFVRIDGTDVIFTHYIVHEDGSYEVIPDKPEEDDPDNPYSERIMYDNMHLYLNDDNTISAEDYDGNIYDLGIRVDYIESLGYSFDGYSSSWITSNEFGEEFIQVSFYPAQTGMNATLSYYGKITDQGLKGGLIKIGISDLPDMSYNTEFVSNDIYVFYNYDNNHFSIPIDFDKLAAAVTPVPESYSSDDGEVEAIISYYPINSLHAATPDSAE